MKRLGNRDFCLALWVLAIAVWILPGGVLTITPLASGTTITAPALNSRISQVKTWSTNLGNDNLASNAAVAYSKLNLAGSIKNTDVSNDAGIDPGKIRLEGGVADPQIAGDAAINPSKIADAGGHEDSVWLTLNASTATANLVSLCQTASCCQLERITLPRGATLTNIMVDGWSDVDVGHDVYLSIRYSQQADGGGDLVSVFDAQVGGLTNESNHHEATPNVFLPAGTRVHFDACEWDNIRSVTALLKLTEDP